MPPGSQLCPAILWNVERLFSPAGSSLARSLDSTARQGWTAAAYQAKVETLATVLRACTATESPALLALVEVENRAVALDVASKAGWRSLRDVEVPDEQVSGYDVALLYDSRVFTAVRESQSFTIHNRFSTRDILRAVLECANGSTLTVYVCHWPSRKLSGSEPYRIAASSFLSSLIERDLKFTKDELFDRSGKPRLPSRDQLAARWAGPVLVLGDFNDNPFDVSITSISGSTRDAASVIRPARLPRGTALNSVVAYLSLQPRLFNPTWQIFLSEEAPFGTYEYAGEWDLLDQAFVSSGLLGAAPPRFVPGSARVPRLRFATTSRGEIEIASPGGVPSSFDPVTLQGASDHLPLILSSSSLVEI